MQKISFAPALWVTLWEWARENSSLLIKHSLVVWMRVTVTRITNAIDADVKHYQSGSAHFIRMQTSADGKLQTFAPLKVKALRSIISTLSFKWNPCLLIVLLAAFCGSLATIVVIFCFLRKDQFRLVNSNSVLWRKHRLWLTSKGWHDLWFGTHSTISTFWLSEIFYEFYI